MWTCGNCREAIEDQFDACWNCGASRDGTLNLDFVRQSDPASDPSSLEQQLAESYVCARCKHREARVERIRGSGTGLAAILKRDFLALSCENCGLTELYNVSVLEGRSNLQEFFRSLFGG